MNPCLSCFPDFRFIGELGPHLFVIADRGTTYLMSHHRPEHRGDALATFEAPPEPKPVSDEREDEIWDGPDDDPTNSALRAALERWYDVAAAATTELVDPTAGLRSAWWFVECLIAAGYDADGGSAELWLYDRIGQMLTEP